MIATVSTTGIATENSDMTMWRSCDIIITPTMTSAAAATSVGTMDASGATNMAARNSTPVTRFAKPVRPLLDARARLDEDGVGRRRRRATHDRTGTLHDQRRPKAREGALRVSEPCLARQPGESAHRVEEVREKQRENEHDRGEHADAPEAAQADVTGEREVGQRERRTRQCRHRQAPAARALGRRAQMPDRLDGDRDQRADHQPDEDAAPHTARDEDGRHQQGEHEDDGRDGVDGSNAAVAQAYWR